MLSSFPSLQELGEDLVCVLDKCDVRTCVALGEGAGAVIVCRFAVRKHMGSENGPPPFLYRYMQGFDSGGLANAHHGNDSSPMHLRDDGSQ